MDSQKFIYHLMRNSLYIYGNYRLNIFYSTDTAQFACNTNVTSCIFLNVSSVDRKEGRLLGNFRLHAV